MADKNSKFFFRSEDIESDSDSWIDVPEDLAWAVEPGNSKPKARQGAGGGGSGNGPLAGGDNSNVDQGYTNPDHYPDTRIDTPVIQGIISQEVSQDPEGKATIDVTFAVTDLRQSSVEWELRITR